MMNYPLDKKKKTHVYSKKKTFGAPRKGERDIICCTYYNALISVVKQRPPTSSCCSIYILTSK